MTRLFSTTFYLIILFSFLISSNLVFAEQQENTDTKKPEQTEKQNEEEKDEQSVEESSEELPNKSLRTPRSEIDITAPTDALINKKSDLKHYLPSQVIQPLLVGPNDHITLINTNNAINNKGIMILLPDWQQTAASPKALNALRETFPDQGWTTITVLPPNKPVNYPSQALEKTAREEQNTTTLNDYQQNLATILSSVTDKAKNYPGIIVVIAEGHNAALLFNIYQKDLTEKPTALITLSAHLNDEMANLESATNLSQLELPVLDLYLKADNYLVNSNVTLRKKWVNQELKENFRQKKIYNIQTGYYPQASLTKEINGWLKSIGW